MWDLHKVHGKQYYLKDLFYCKNFSEKGHRENIEDIWG